NPRGGAASGGAGIVMRVRNNAGRLVLLALLAIGILAAWHWRGVFDPASLTALIDKSPAAPLVFIGLHIVASLVFVPRTLLALGAGLVLGMWWGAISAAASASGPVGGARRDCCSAPKGAAGAWSRSCGSCRSFRTA